MSDRNSIINEPNRDNLIGSAIINDAAHIVIADEVVYSFLGTSYSFSMIDSIHPDHREEFKAYMEKCSFEPLIFLTRCKRYDDEYVNVSVLMKHKLVDGKVYISVDLYDIVYITQEYEGFLVTNKIFNTLVALSDKIFFRFDTENKQLYVYNGKKTFFCGGLDLYRTTMVETGCVAESSMQQFQQMCDEIAAAKGEGFYKLNTTLFNSEGDAGFNPTYVSFAPVEFNSQVCYIVGFFAGGTASTGIESYAANRSNLDPLTNLLNKKAIKDYSLEALARAGKEGSVVTFVMIDLDNFKTINDTYGHMFGDETLVNVARVMNETVGDRGVVGRIGGDEFFIVLTGFEDGDEAIRPLLRSIRSHVEWCFKNKIDDIKVTCSVGTATYPKDAKNYDDLFKLADHCLYVAKSKGRDRFIIYTGSIHGSLEEILSSGTVIQMANFVSEADKSKHLLSLIQRFNDADYYDRQQVVLKKAMLELLYYYDLDAVQYVPLDENKASYDVSNYEITAPRALVELYTDYSGFFNKKGYFTMGNYDNAKSEFPALYDYMISAELFSVMMILDVGVDGETRGIFAVSTHKRYQKWAAFDINMLLIIFKLMERFVH